MRWSDTARVGAAVIAAALLLAGIYMGIHGLRPGARPRAVRIAFEDAQGVKPNAEVRVQGVKVGEVRTVGLEAGRAVLGVVFDTARLPDKVRARIAGALLGFSSPQVELVPDPAGQVLPNYTGPVERAPIILGEETARAEALVPKASQMVDNLNRLAVEMGNLARNLNRVVGNTQAQNNLLEITRNFAAGSRNLEQFARSTPAIARNMERFSSSMPAIGRNMEQFSRSAPAIGRNLAAGSSEFRALLTTFQQTAHQMDSNLAQITTQLNRTLAQTEGLATDFRASAGDFQGAARELHAAAAENRPRLGQLLEGLQGSLTTLNATLAQAQGLIGDPQLRANLNQTAANLAAATETLSQVARDAQSITGDPQVQKDLKDAIAALRDATQQAAAAFGKANSLLGSGSDTIEGLKKKVEDTAVESEVVYLPHQGRVRAGIDATILWTEDSFWRFGLFDAGEKNGLNAQYGQHELFERWTLPRDTWLRYGVHDSHLGLGLDFGDPGRPTLSADLFNANRPRLDLRGSLRLTDYLDATLGLDSLFQHPLPVLGLRYQMTR